MCSDCVSPKKVTLMFASHAPLISVMGEQMKLTLKNELLHLLSFCSKRAFIWAGFQRHFSWMDSLNAVMEYHGAEVLYLHVPRGSLSLLLKLSLKSSPFASAAIEILTFSYLLIKMISKRTKVQFFSSPYLDERRLVQGSY